MFCEMIDDAFLVSMSGTSEGTQIKYYKDGYWYKRTPSAGKPLQNIFLPGCLRSLIFPPVTMSHMNAGT